MEHFILLTYKLFFCFYQRHSLELEVAIGVDLDNKQHQDQRIRRESEGKSDKLKMEKMSFIQLCPYFNIITRN